MEYNTETKPDSPGILFNAVVLVGSKQKILVLRCNLTSYSSTMFVKDEQKPTLREALIVLASRIRLNKNILVRVDNQSSFKSLVCDPVLRKMGVQQELGQSKNKNKNAVAEKAIKELRSEILKIAPRGGLISEGILERATDNLKSLIRYTDRSAKELWMRRDQTSGSEIQSSDQTILDQQFEARKLSHSHHLNMILEIQI